MGLMSWLGFRASSQSIGPPRDPVVAAWFGGNASATGLSVTPDTAMRVTAVYRAVTLLAQTYASLPLGVYKYRPDGGKELDRSHPLHHILHDQPNDWQTSFEWREMMAGHLALRGVAYSEIVSAGGRGVAKLIPLHPDRVRGFKTPDGRMAYAYAMLEGGQRIILQSEMHRLIGYSEDGINPVSPVEKNREAIGLALATEEHGARLFSNGTRLGGMLKMAGHLKDDPARERLLSSWAARFSGIGNAYKTALMEDGLEWQQMGMTNEDSQFIDARKMQIAEIARIFGVPLHMLGDLSNSTNNNIEHQGMEYVTHTIRPGAVRWEQAMKRDLFFGDSATTHTVEFNLEGLMRGDSAARSAFYSSALANGYKTRNEVRALENDNRSEDDGMDSFTIQLNMRAIDAPVVVRPKAHDGQAQRELIEAIAGMPKPEVRVDVAQPVINITNQPAEVNVAPAAVTIADGAVRVDVSRQRCGG